MDVKITGNNAGPRATGRAGVSRTVLLWRRASTLVILATAVWRRNEEEEEEEEVEKRTTTRPYRYVVVGRFQA